jgi:hypothetical protein
MLLKVISCDALRREICAAAGRSKHRADLEFLPAAHGDGPELVATVQSAIDRATEDLHDAIVLAYALCGKSVAGIESRGVLLVIPRSAGCAGFHSTRPGVCFHTTGWTQREGAIEPSSVIAVRGEKACAARYTTFKQVTYVTTSPAGEPSRRAHAESPLLRDRHDLFDHMLSGEWDETEFLLVPQGWRVAELPGRGIDREPIS